jgi:hypothetical protein
MYLNKSIGKYQNTIFTLTADVNNNKLPNLSAAVSAISSFDA